ncbi:hypothetical protein NONO_c32710 [Nocardia nova SH22a]|uniref:Uncharacterized protein n=1 Tax=Nocardia nova SH22a TaxID=1415166 RepID=W5TGE4_9NOCA|nr:hypothetical protein [Nocardia nova]AHH18058.1 hypothetical protein NONO_c32710 [Nocardia nova SH22a]
MVLLLLLFVVVLVVGGGAALAVVAVNTGQRRRVSAANQLVPGVPSRAPESWALSHDPEARLHRRLRDAMAALRAVTAYDTVTTVTLRANLEQAALAMDDHLIAISALRPEHREPRLAKAAEGVAAIEAGVAEYAGAATQPDPAALDAGLAGVQDRLRMVGDIQRGFGPS